MVNLLLYFKRILSKLSVGHTEFKFSESTKASIENAEKQSELFRIEIEKYKNTKL